MRIVREILFSVLLLRCSGVLAQVFDDEPYYPFAPYEEERMPELESDSLLFYRAVQQADDLWAEVSAFRFSAVSYRRRRFYAADDSRPARRPPHEGRRILDGGVRRAVCRARFAFLFGGGGGVYAAGFQLLQSRMGSSGGRCA